MEKWRIKRARRKPYSTTYRHRWIVLPPGIDDHVKQQEAWREAGGRTFTDYRHGGDAHKALAAAHEYADRMARTATIELPKGWPYFLTMHPQPLLTTPRHDGVIRIGTPYCGIDVHPDNVERLAVSLLAHHARTTAKQ